MFWEKLSRPIIGLAPMANVTDAAFRRIIAKYGKPDVCFTEFTSCDGLLSKGKEKLLVDLWFDESERPIVVQLFGATPEHFYKCALLAQELGFDGIDINMGCPDRAVERQGAGAALIKNPELAKKIIYETKRGAGPLPVSVKTRLGYNEVEIDTWIPHLLETGLAAITVHGRTRKEMSLVPAHWDEIANVAAFVRSHTTRGTRPLILGNGDVNSLEQAQEYAKKYEVDGVLIGRGIFGNPFLFSQLHSVSFPRMRESRDHGSQIKSGMTKNESPSLKQKLSVMAEHVKLFEELFGERSVLSEVEGGRTTRLKPFDIMKKHFKAYVNGFPDAKELRIELMNTKSAAEVEKVVKKFLT